MNEQVLSRFESEVDAIPALFQKVIDFFNA